MRSRGARDPVEGEIPFRGRNLTIELFPSDRYQLPVSVKLADLCRSIVVIKINKLSIDHDPAMPKPRLESPCTQDLTMLYVEDIDRRSRRWTMVVDVKRVRIFSPTA